jgi:hypothetical protein
LVFQIMSLVLTAEISPRRMPHVLSLNELWGGKGRWTKTKKLVLKARGTRCEICGDEPDQLHLHEVWEYVNVEETGLEPEVARLRMVDWLYEEAVAHHRTLATLPTKELLASEYKPVARWLVGLQLLCRVCHDCKHAYHPSRETMAHWCRVNKASLEQCGEHYQAARAANRGVVATDVFYSGYDTLPDYKSVDDWQEAMRDEANAWHEDDWIYAENEMNDSGFLHRGN